MYKILLSAMIGIVSLPTFASWNVQAVNDDMTDNILYYELASQSQQGDGRFSLVCYRNGIKRSVIWQPEYIGYSQGALAKIGIDGVIQTITPVFERLRIDSHFLSMDYTQDLVNLMKKGREMRIKVIHRHTDSGVYKHSLMGFTDAYKQYVQKCNSFT